MIIKNFWPGIVWGVIIFILSAMPGNYIPQVQSFASWINLDKVVHVCLYFVFCYLLQKGFFRQYHHNKKKLLFGLLFVVIFGGVMEIMQHYFFIGRNGNIFDFFANLFGCVLSYALFLFIKRKKSLKSN